MKILITGSSGMLGTELCEVLDIDDEIVGLDVVEPSTKGQEKGKFYKASITDSRQIDEIFNREKPELVIHTAAWTDVDGCEKEPKKAYSINVDGTRNITEVCCEKSIPLMFISTDFVFDGKKNKPYIEIDKAHPISVYGKTKHEGEAILKKLLLNYAIIRTSGLYGRNGNNFVDTIVAKARSKKDLKVVDDQIVSPTYAYDLACALKKFIGIWQLPGQEIYHVANQGRCSWYTFAEYIIKNIKGLEDVKVEPITSLELKRLAPRPKFSVLDNSKFKKFTGYKLRTWQEALKEYLEVR